MNSRKYLIGNWETSRQANTPPQGRFTASGHGKQASKCQPEASPEERARQTDETGCNRARVKANPMAQPTRRRNKKIWRHKNMHRPP